MKRGSLPNCLTALRIGSVVPIIVLLLLQYEVDGLRDSRVIDIINFSIYCLSSITDLIDGYLARRWNIVSPFGIVLDPIADKFLALGPLYILIPLRGIHPLPVLLISLREIWIMGLRTLAVKEGILIGASQSGKWKAVFINVSILLILFNTGASVKAGKFLLWIASLIAVYSGVEYTHSFFSSYHGDYSEKESNQK